MASARFWLVLALAALAAPGMLASAGAAEPASKRYALLVAVTTYDHAEMNRKALAFPEADATAVAEFLREHDYEVDRLFGAAATREAILAKLATLKEKGNETGAVVVGFWGHGVQYDGDGESRFCPFDAGIREVADADGKPLFDAAGQARLEPDPATLVGMREVLAGLRKAGGGNRVLLADCCRDDPSTARGRAFGSTTRQADIPDNTVALFACSDGEQAFESPEWGHGAFTKCLLELLPMLADGEGDDVTRIVGRLRRNVASLVKAKTSDRLTQRVNAVTNGTPELRLKIALATKPTQPPEPTGPKPGEVITNSLGMKLVRIPAGQFLMGSDETKENLALEGFDDGDVAHTRVDDEKPRHRVRISKPFLIGQQEVTLGQFLVFYEREFKGKLDCEKSGAGGRGVMPAKAADADRDAYQAHVRPWNYGHPDMQLSTEAERTKAFRYPVVNVSWNDCVAFCDWLSRKESKTYRLPTEAEWEYSCRAGSTTRFWHGNDPKGLFRTDNVADGTRGTAGKLDGHEFAAPVGAFARPNPFGLHDMHGNVAEWCLDWYDDSYYKKSPAIDPRGPSTGTQRVLRVGGWEISECDSRSSRRFHDPPDSRWPSLGFRVVCEIK